MSNVYLYLAGAAVSLLGCGYLYVRYLRRQGEKALAQTLILQAELHTAEQRHTLQTLKEKEDALEKERIEAAKRFRDAVSSMPPASEWGPGADTDRE